MPPFLIRFARRFFLAVIGLGFLVSGGPVVFSASPASAQPLPYAAYVGYADNLRANPAAFPTPFDDPSVVYDGCALPCTFDGGVVKIQNTSASPITVNSVEVIFDTCKFLWLPTNNIVQVGKSLVVAQEASGSGNGCTPGAPVVNPPLMDSSDIGPMGAPWSMNCTQSGVKPKVIVTVGGVATTFTDALQVLNTGGVDSAYCPPVAPGMPLHNESIPWDLLPTSCVPEPLILSLSPSSQTQPVDGTAIVDASLNDTCGGATIADPGALVTFVAASGPNKGATFTGTAGSNGTTSFPYSSAVAGTPLCQP